VIIKANQTDHQNLARPFFLMTEAYTLNRHSERPLMGFLSDFSALQTSNFKNADLTEEAA
jgi:hypothetical protein